MRAPGVTMYELLRKVCRRRTDVDDLATLRDRLRMTLPQQDEAPYQAERHHGQDDQLDHCVPELHLALRDELGELGGDHEDAAYTGDQRDEHEGFRHEDVLAEGKLNGVE